MNMETSYWKSFFMPCTGYFYQKRHNDSKSVCPSNSIPDIPIPSPDLYPSELALLNLHEFTFAEMNSVTNYKSSRNFLGEGGFGPVYKGFLPDKLRPGLEEQHVAVKYLDQEGNQGHKEWMAEVRCLGQYRHPNLVKLIGYCCEKQHRMLVYEYMPGGSLENLLFMKSLIEPFSWLQRLKIAVEAAKGLAFLHDAEKPLIYRDFKASNILLDSDYTAKLSDFGLAKDGPQGDEYISTRPMGTYGYAAPDYLMTGHLTAKSDVYSFGVVLLELLTGRRCLDESRCARERNLVDWARPYLKRPDKFHKIMDPNLQGNYSTEAAQKAALVVYLCLSNKSKPRPRMKEVIDVLEPLLQIKEFPMGTFIFIVPEVDENCGKMKSVDENLVTGEDHERRERRDHRRRSRRHVHSVVHAEGGLQREAKDLSEDSLRRHHHRGSKHHRSRESWGSEASICNSHPIPSQRLNFLVWGVN